MLNTGFLWGNPHVKLTRLRLKTKGQVTSDPTGLYKPPNKNQTKQKHHYNFKILYTPRFYYTVAAPTWHDLWIIQSSSDTVSRKKMLLFYVQTVQNSTCLHDSEVKTEISETVFWKPGQIESKLYTRLPRAESETKQKWVKWPLNAFRRLKLKLNYTNLSLER